ncbi:MULTISPECIES: HD domain-containing protein [unclassified Moraxella]|uniref:HD domain-containing protein n=1 Tax=unclassified Moraxella TaxID=2685852 RepID=UPI003AF79925
MQTIIHYLLAIDALKNVNRRNYITPHPSTGEQRLENSAEHSWHLAMACWAFNAYFKLGLNQEKLLKMALVHDLGEIDAGDTFLYADNRATAHVGERMGVVRLANLAGQVAPPLQDELLNLWDEQEVGDSQETKLLKAIDRILPFMLNMVSQGGAWRDHAVKRSQVVKAQAFIEQDFPSIHAWITEQIDVAVVSGWLVDD